jgi:hypothetical protein
MTHENDRKGAFFKIGQVSLACGLTFGYVFANIPKIFVKICQKMAKFAIIEQTDVQSDTRFGFFTQFRHILMGLTMENLTHGNEGWGIFRKHISVHFLNKCFILKSRDMPQRWRHTKA